MAQLRYWVWLTALEGLRSVSIPRLMDRFGGPMEIYFAPYEAYDDVEGLTGAEKAQLRNKDLARTEEILEICQRENVRIMTIQDADYPERLRQIADPPPVLYVRGRLPFLDELPAIAVVGTRKASPYGIKTATRLGQEIAAAGGCVVTGLALGVDAAAARGALLENGTVVGVLGSAVNVNYPPANALLIDDVAAIGAVVSEFPPGYPIRGENFPRRNRIISGLSCGVCVVEAPRRSGALITANLALEQGRDLFAVPGNADSPNSVGPNELLKDCAKAVTCGMDILEEYTGLFPSAIDPTAQTFTPAPPAVPEAQENKSDVDKPRRISYIDVDKALAGFPEDQQRMLSCLKEGEAHVDDIIAATGFSPAKVLAGMTVLTIKGVVKALPGKRYRLEPEKLDR